MNHTLSPQPRFHARGLPCALAILLAAAPAIGRSAQAQYAIGTLATGFSAGAIAVNPINNKVYVGNVALSGQVMEPGGQYPVMAPFTIVDAVTKASTTFTAGFWSDIKVNPVTNKVYVAGAVAGFGNDLMVIDGATDAITFVPVVAGAVAVGVNPVTNKIYAAGDLGGVTVVDGATNATVTLTVGGSPCAVAVNEVTNRIYIANNNANYVTVIDGLTNAITNVNIGSVSLAVAVNPVTNKIYAASAKLMVIDGATNAVTAVAVGSGPCVVAVNPVTNKIYTANFDSANVTVIDGATNAATNVAIGLDPAGLAVNPGTNQVFVTNSYNANFSVIDGTTNAVTASFSTGSYADYWLAQTSTAIALNPVTNNVYIPTVAGVYVINGNNKSGIPSFSSEPAAETVNIGVPAVLSAFAGGPSSTTYLWMKDGIPLSDGAAIEGSSTPTLYLSGGASLADTGSYSCVATNSAGSTSSNEAPLTVVASPNPGHLINLSTRAFVDGGGDTLIAGFVVRGAGSKTLILRAIGPALAGLGVSGVMPAPVLSLYDAASPANMIAQDLDWQYPPMVPMGPWQGEVAPVEATAADFSQVGAFALTPGSSDSAFKITLPAGAYTSQVGPAVTYMSTGSPTDTGVALAEIYSDDAGAPTTQLVNISSRAFVGTGSNVLIAGFVISGSTSQTVLIRASGPALQPFGVPGVLPDPELQLFDGSENLIASNSSWGGNSQIASASANSGAFQWGNPSSADSAILITLPPGNYTAEVSGQRGDTGVGLIEVCAVPPVVNSN